ncbi:integrase [Campylobacter sp. MIT 12-5580]|uniref:tyrosine-type recombinase/integrase n=1 Tax=Campylobacter sp. MIT 12-5580 TaxID=2040651 RepID=UPI0010F5B4D6|nr:site-specific integrase [Campylobacter sp. MIT 12-5580]TKX28076.1 integrase [Campylobacter sp. MIT 12-5580]
MLSCKKIKSLKAKEKRYFVADRDNLLLCVYPSGTKTFFYNFKCPNNKCFKRISLGKYPQTSLKAARYKRYTYKTALQQNAKKSQKISFKSVALEKMSIKKDQIAPKTHARLLSLLERFAFTIFADKDISSIEIDDILVSFELLRKKGLGESANKFFSIINEIFRFAELKKLITTNPLNSLLKKELIIKKPTKHHPSFYDEKNLSILLQKIASYQGKLSLKIALIMTLLTAQRSFNIRTCLWSELDLKRQIWIIPQHKMKAKRMLILPLSTQIIELLTLYKNTQIPKREAVFHSTKTKDQFIGESSMRMVLRALDYSNDELSVHGLRSTFSTICHEKRQIHKINSDIIELCLAHKEKNQVKASYNHALFQKEKQELMQWWGDYITQLVDWDLFCKNLFARL